MKISLLSNIETVPALRRNRTSLVFTACASLLIAGSWTALADGGSQTVHNAVPAAVAKAKMVRPSMRLEKLNLSIGLPLRNSEALTNMLQQIYDPASPNFHHYLTPEQFTEKFGPTQKDYDAVVKFAQDHGLTVTSKHSNRVVVGVKGIVGDIERAFHVKLNEYQHPTEARTFRAPNTDPTLDISVPVASIGGLDTFQLPRACARPMTNIAGQHLGDNPVPQTGSGPSGAYDSKDFRAAYLPGATQTGTGQVVGLFELSSGFYQSDITAFETATGAPNVPVIPVLLDSYGGGPGSGNDEVSLDIEMAIGMAPGLEEVLVFEGSSPDDIFSSMTTYSPLPLQLSASWTYSIDSTSESLFMEMAMQGQSFFNASGDSDAYVGAPPPPTDDVNITVVGGTTLSTTGAVGSWTGEVVWNDNPSPAGQGTGGGISTRNAIPIWQQGISMAANQGSTTMRNSPDVAACANNVYVYYGGGSAGAFVGTSCATPTWAAYVACANQLALADGQSPVGFINPAVYSMGKGSNALSYAALFHDITSGNNEWSSSPNNYIGAVGLDLCTGWGTPTGTNLLTALALPEPLRITPFVPAVFSGGAGGPFSPASQTYTLTNNATGTTLNWALSALPSWLDASPTNGTLVSGGAAAMVTLTIDPSADSLAGGSYSTTLYFTNVSDGFAQSVSVTLAVVSAPVITVQPTNEAVLTGGTASFVVGAAPDALIYYQWLINGAALTSANAKANVFGYTTSNLLITNVNSTNVANYSVILSNVAGVVTSSVAALSITPSLPVIITQPTNESVLPGATASFSVYVNGNTPYTYHWMFNGANLVNSAGKYGGATNATLFITNAIITNAGNFTVSISNSLGVVTSSVAVLSLTPVTVAPYNLVVNASFTGGTSVANPYCAVVYDAATSAYYGTSYMGGADGGGCTFKVTAAGTVTREHSFGGSTDGAFPVAGLCLGKDGGLYGASLEYGGDFYGSIWKQSATATTLTAYTQFNNNNGNEPVAAMMQASDGNLYGTANLGGDYNDGTIFRVSSVGGVTNLTVVTSFDGANGIYPSPVFVQGTDGNLYGTAENGGAYTSSAGTVYRISLSGAFTLLHSFNGSTDGAVPIAGVIQGVDGNFYGTTLEGGANNLGTVYEISPTGAFNTLYSFTGGADGAEPWGGLIQAADGNLYGTTQQGGTYSDGTVFQISPTGSFKAIAQFDGFQGATSEANLVLGPDGNLYGTTYAGGSASSGVFFSIVLTNGAAMSIDGQPASLAVYGGSNAVFAVATTGGAPLSYQWLQNGTNITNGGGFTGATTAVLTISNVVSSNAAAYTVIVSNAFNMVTSTPAMLTVLFTSPVITSQPVSQTDVVGSIAFLSVTVTGEEPLSYQWLQNGVNLTNGGTISGSTTPTLVLSNVVVSNSGSYTVIVSNAMAAVTSSVAVVIVVPANASTSVGFTNVHSFTNAAGDGANSYAALIQAFDGNLYGTASAGGTSGVGTIFKSTLAGVVNNFYSFPAPNDFDGANDSGYGNDPQGGLIQTANSNFYGTTYYGGADAYGTFFQVSNTSPTAYSETYPHAFTGSEGAYPEDTLVLAPNGSLYGAAFEGGSIGYGSLFETTTTGTVTLLYSFTAASDGANPAATLVMGSDGNLYGTTTAAGNFDWGTLFSYNPTTATFTTLVEFDYANGGNPYAGLMQHTNGTYYGVTIAGGANGYGEVYSYSTNTGLSVLYSFSGSDGAFPAGALIQGTDGNLYGTCEEGGSGGQGVVFQLTTNGVLTDLAWFDGYNGASPEAALLQASNGIFYGTAGLGGTGFDPYTGGGNGTIFSVAVPLFIHASFTLTNAVTPVPYSNNITSKAVTPAGDTLIFALVSGPAWLTVASNGVVSGTAPTNSLGTNVFVVSVSDSNGFYSTATMSIPVIADPAPAFLKNPFTEPAATVGSAYGATIATNATTAYISSGDVLTFGLVSGPSWLTVATNGLLSGTPAIANVGTNTFVVGVTNLGGGSATATMLIIVPAPSTPPTFVVAAGQPNLGSNGFQFTFSGPSGLTYEVLSSSNLTVPLSQWTVVGSGTFSSTNVVLTDTNALNNPYQFYIIEEQ